MNSKNGRTKMFVNLPVSELGFAFSPMFTDENAACMIISEDIYSMLLVEKFFKSFIPDKKICDTKKSFEAIIALSANTRKEVDGLIIKAVSAGSSEYRQAQDHGWMYGRAF